MIRHIPLFGLPIVALLSLAACGGSGPVQQEREPPDDTLTPDPPVDRPIGDVDLGDGRPGSGNFGPPPTLQSDNGSGTHPISGLVLIDDRAGGKRIIARTGDYEVASETATLDGVIAPLNNVLSGDFGQSASFAQPDGNGVLGITTPFEPQESAGVAEYAGAAAGAILTGDNGIDLVDGDSTIVIDFRNSDVDVTLDRFDAINQVSGLIVDSPVSEIELRDAVVNGTGFIGGTLTVRDTDGDVVDFTGANTSTDAEGQFYGADGDQPDEVGGIIYSQGDEGVVFGTFLAD